MKLVHLVKNFFASFIDRFVVFAFALALSQMPTFMNQYADALTGSIYKSEKIIKRITIRARKNGKSLLQFIEKHLASGDIDFKNSGEEWKKISDELKSELLAQKAINEASIWTRPFVFIRHLDASLVKKIKYKPALPFSFESIVYVLFGILFGMIFYKVMLQLPARKIFSSNKSNNSSNGTKRSRLTKQKSGKSKATKMPDMPTFELSDEFKSLK